jgi:phage gp29-like protein
MFKSIKSLFSAPAKKETMMALTHSESIERQLMRFGWLGDADETLQKAGITRAQLRSLETDDEITAALETRRDACINTPWRLEHPSVRTRKAMEAIIAPHVNDILNNFWGAVPYGYSVIEVVYKPNGSGVNIDKIVSVPFEWVLPTTEQGLVWWDIQQPLDTRKFFACIRQPTLRNPKGEAMLSRLYWVWFFRTNGWKFWMKYLERAGVPFIVGKTAGDQKQALNALMAAVQDSVIIAGRDDTVEALDFGRDPKIFTEFETAVVRRYQRLILGQTLTSGTDGGSAGSKALGQVHNEVRNEKKRSDIKLVAAAMQTVINTIAELNAMEAPTFIMEDGSGLALERATRDKILVDGGMLKFTPEYLIEKYGFEASDFVPTQDEPKLRPPEPATLSANFNASQPQFTPAQQAIEAVADSALAATKSPIDASLIRTAVLAATSPEDLEHRLSLLINQRDARFQDVLAQAIFSADVIGYVSNEKGLS